MDIEEDGFGCLGIPTPLEMWKQHAHLVETEVEQLLADLRQTRANLVKVVSLQAGTAAERDALKAELDETKSELGSAYRELTSLKNRQWEVITMKEQYYELLRKHDPEHLAYMPPIRKDGPLT